MRSPEKNRPARRSFKVALALFVAAVALHLAPTSNRLVARQSAPLADRVPAPQLAAAPQERVAHVHRPRPTLRLPGVRFSFAILSDLHEAPACGLGIGKLVDPAVQQINRLRPDFVVGLGDLVAGGGDCLGWGRGWPDRNLGKQLQVLDERVVSKLEVPFVPVGGNHDLTSLGSKDRRYPKDAWDAFWQARRHKILPAARAGLTTESQRFTYQGVGFVIAGYYDTFGLDRRELRWLEKNLRPADLVFRHINPFGLSCLEPGDCGTAIRSWPMKRYERLTELLHKRRVAALFSGHTHSFFDGWCDGLRYVNSGSLGSRSMEYLKGWERSPYRKRQAWVWVDVLTNASLRVTFFVWDPKTKRFRPFDNRHFPARIEAVRRSIGGYEEGVAAECLANQRRPAHPAAFFAAGDRSR